MEKEIDDQFLAAEMEKKKDNQFLTAEDTEKVQKVFSGFKSTNAFDCLSVCLDVVRSYENYRTTFRDVVHCSQEKLDLLYKYVYTSKTDEEKKQKQEEFFQLKDYAYRTILDLLILQKANDPVISELSKKRLSFADVLDALSEPMADLAMLDLQGEGMSRKERLEKLAGVQEELNAVRQKCFAECVSGKSWVLANFKGYQALMKMQALDSLTKQVIVSGIMLACLNGFDYLKWRLLLDLYSTSQDVDVKQRALVAIVLIAPKVPLFYVEKAKNDLLDLFLKDKRFKPDLLMVSKLIVRAKNSENDSNQVHNILMKGLMSATTHMLKQRMGEQEENELNGEDGYADDADGYADGDREEGEDHELFHLSEEEEEEYHEFKDLAQEMFGMLDSGADIYLQQFKKTMDEDFFNSTFNWFMPIHLDHPVVLRLRSKLKNGDEVLKALFANSTMCNNDAFGFLLSLPQKERDLKETMKHLIPQDLLDYENSEEKINQEENPKKVAFRATVRCLQDLYRFFMLSPMRHSFVNPFENIAENPAVALTSKVFSPEAFDKVRLPLARYCLEKEEYEAIRALLQPMKLDSEEYHYMLAKGYSMSAEPDYDEAFAHVCKLLELNPDNQRFLFLMIDVCQDAKRWNDELPYINCVLAQECSPESRKQVMIHKVVCLGDLKKWEEAVNCAYELYLDYPEDEPIVLLLGEMLLRRAPADPKTWDKVSDLAEKALERKKKESNMPSLSEVSKMSPLEGLNKLMEMMSHVGKVDHTFEPHFYAQLAVCFWLKHETRESISNFVEMLQVAQKLDGCPNTELNELDLSKYFPLEILYANGMNDEDVSFLSEMVKEFYNGYVDAKNKELKKLLAERRRK